MELKDKLKQVWTEKGLTQEQLAEKLYVIRSTIAKWGNGLGLPNPESMAALEEIFSITSQEIATKEPETVIVEKNRKLRLVGRSWADQPSSPCSSLWAFFRLQSITADMVLHPIWPQAVSRPGVYRHPRLPFLLLYLRRWLGRWLPLEWSVRLENRRQALLVMHCGLRQRADACDYQGQLYC